ncbi:MAG TPA: hypothetical protein VE860_17675 [Chthoniobacterales bacterium]|jgi:hypothetical protein|nr:hypothetical protein [Chthoniobacterales bacterium]
MKIAKGFDNQESLPLPADQMFAIVDDSDKATRVAEVLNQNGFSRDDIGILVGPEDARKLDAATGMKGIFAKILATGIDMGDKDSDYIKKYRRALVNGRVVVGVAVKNEDMRTKARGILRAAHARFITFFGQFVTELLEA